MKKVLIFVIIFLFLGYVIYQNGSLWLLKILSLTSDSSRNTYPYSSSSGPTPPYKDGTYTGNQADAFYGNIQVQTVISNGKISDIQFIQYPNDRARSIAINTLAIPSLKQEAIQAQSAQVDIISGASASSQAFQASLVDALSQAK